MNLAGYASTILHPLIRVLAGAHDETRRDAMDTITALAVPLGPEFAIFAPTIKKVSPWDDQECLTWTRLVTSC